MSDKNPSLNQKPAVKALGLSRSAVSKAVARCKYAGLLVSNDKTVMKMALMKLLGLEE
ncbi:MAG: MarR family transcriptional regulator [Cyclobacteriaceae bacterium]|nr:MarR family transcriptional regulator [Cyclobacteriaceae bacterium]